jgi:hypothetical protein
MSTAIWDPKWFHQFKGKKHIWKDSNGVYNGIRAEELNPGLCHAEGCPCPYQHTDKGYNTCSFLKSYREGLSDIDFDKFLNKCIQFAEFLSKRDNFKEEPIIVFIFHEAPDNPCSERIPVQELFNSHGIELTEWYPNK